MDLNNLINTSRILGLLLMPFSVTMLPPIFIALWYRENTVLAFCSATLTTLLIGFALWYPFRKHHQELQVRETFLIVVLLWIVLSLTGAFPFTFAERPHISYLDAVFETISGLTTTGATVLSGLYQIPRSIIYYRQQLQFIGGGGIILLGVAILPILGIGGMQLFRAEIGGPFKEDKLTPRVAETAKTLWLLYVGLAVLCALCYWLAGMDLFEAIGYSFSTISTGGFDMHDQTFSYFNSILLEYICVFFMIMGSINFSLHFSILRRRHFLAYWQDPEFKLFMMFWLYMIALVGAILFYHRVFDQTGTILGKSIFQVTTFLTTTGFASSNFNEWPPFIPMLLAFLCLIGGCAGSTAGGIKMIRLLILKKQGNREILRLIHPNGHYLIKLENNRFNPRALEAILGFFCVFVATFIVVFLILLGLGLNPLTAYSATTASISNTGIGPNLVTGSFKAFSEPVKITIAIAMLAGRLELFTLLILLVPSYWRY